MILLRRNIWIIFIAGCILALTAIIFNPLGMLVVGDVAAPPVVGEVAAPPEAYPEPGTYELYKIQKAGSGWVLEGDTASRKNLLNYTSRSITLFTFFYATCRDPEGCPAVWSAYATIHEAVQEDPMLKGKIRLVFVSLDPKVDTPERLQLYADAYKDSQAIVPWHFLTTQSEKQLRPILGHLGLTAFREVDDLGKPTSIIAHMVKVFLIDRESWVREIYTTSFFDPEVVLNDMRTLAMEEERKQRGTN